MALIAQALTTLKAVRLYLKLYTYTNITSTETLTADTADITFSFANTDIAPNTIGTISEASGTASDTVSTALMTYDYDLGTITFSAAKTGNITAASYSYFAWDYSKDIFLERQINSASSMVSKYCNRKFIADTYSEFYKGSGRQRLVLNQYPINSITSVSVNSAALTAGTDYVTADSTYLNQGIIFKNNGWTWYGYLTGIVGELTAPIDNIEVVYSAGYTLSPMTLPYDLENTVIFMVADAYGTQNENRIGLKELTQGKLNYIWKDDSLIQQYSSTLNIYAKKVF